MNAWMEAWVNGALWSVPLTAAVWMGLRLTSRHGWNASTRYLVWWMTLATVVALPLMHTPVVMRASDAHPAARTAPIVPEESAVAAARVPAVHAWFPLAIAAGGWAPGILAAWALASILLLARLIASFVWLGRLQSRATALPDRDGVKVAVSDEIATPMAVGPRRRAILLPAHLVGRLTADELEQIVSHESAHLARRDDLALIVERVLEALVPWHPVLRWIGRRVELERELACDAMVVAATGRARAYAACLTRMVELGCSGSRPVAGAAAVGGSQLTERVESLLDSRRPTGTGLLRWRLAAMVVAIGGMAIVTARARPPVLLQTRAAQGISHMPVAVVDPLNRFVTGLGRESFRIRENGVELPLVEFHGPDEPISVVVVYDASGDQALRALEKPVRADSEIFRVEVKRELPDASVRAARALAQARYRQRIVVALGVPCGTLGAFDTPLYCVDLAGDPVAAARRVSIELRNRYELSWKPVDSTARVEVSVSAPGLPPLRVIRPQN